MHQKYEVTNCTMVGFTDVRNPISNLVKPLFQRSNEKVYYFGWACVSISVFVYVWIFVFTLLLVLFMYCTAVWLFCWTVKWNLCFRKHYQLETYIESQCKLTRVVAVVNACVHFFKNSILFMVKFYCILHNLYLVSLHLLAICAGLLFWSFLRLKWRIYDNDR